MTTAINDFIKECNTIGINMSDITTPIGHIGIGDNFCADAISSELEKTLDFELIFQEMAKRFNQVPLMEHKCNNCGAVISMDADKHLFTCKYCGSAYAVGTAQIYS